ncbi:MAG: Wzz/FepE/Etk N-terminal domain-containing protein [Clostridiales bacterium]|nr:Wzz/FepE/Etk N-terminal domain-containing protein [Clostridiales bacterium]
MAEEQKIIAEDNEIVIDIAKLFKALWQRAWIIVLVALLGCSLAYLGTKSFVQPTYRAVFTAYVNNNSSDEWTTTVSNADLTAAQSLVYTYTHILTSRTMLLAAAEEIGADYTYEDMCRWVTTDVVEDTEIIEVRVTMNSPEEALALAEAIAAMMPIYVTEIVEGSSAQIIDMPVLPESIYAPSYIRNALIGGVLCAFLAAAVILLLELLDDTVKEEETLEQRFGVTVIGVIPDLASADKYASHYGYGSYGHKAEAKSSVGGKLVKNK